MECSTTFLQKVHPSKLALDDSTPKNEEISSVLDRPAIFFGFLVRFHGSRDWRFFWSLDSDRSLADLSGPTSLFLAELRFIMSGIRVAER